MNCDGTNFAATIKTIVDTSRTVQAGEQIFRLRGKIVGQEIVGKVDTIYKGKVWKSGTDFMGSLRPVE